MLIKPKLRYFVLLILIVTLSACGFHLRQSENYPSQLHDLYISSSTPYGQFEQILRNTLNDSNIKIVENPQHATATLEIIGNNFTQNSTNISSNTQLRQYNLNLIISFRVVLPNGAVGIPTQSIGLTRQYTANINQVLGGNTEQENLKEIMMRNAAFRVTLILGSDEAKAELIKAEKHTKVLKK